MSFLKVIEISKQIGRINKIKKYEENVRRRSSLETYPRCQLYPEYCFFLRSILISRHWKNIIMLEFVNVWALQFSIKEKIYIFYIIHFEVGPFQVLEVAYFCLVTNILYIND